MNRRNLLIRVGALAAAGGVGWWLREHVLWRGPDLSFPDGETGSGWLPFAHRAPVPTARVTVAGRDVTALIDSGARYSVIDRELAGELGLDGAFDMPLVAYGVSGQPQVGRGVTLDVRLGGLTIGGLRTAILDLGPLADPEGLSAPLILGQDVLADLVLELDMTGRRLQLVRPDAHALPEGLVAVPVRRKGAALWSEITVEGTVVEAVVDTGSSALLSLGRSVASEAGLLDGRAERATSSLVLGGVLAATVVEARTVTFGETLHRRVPTAIYEDVTLPGFPSALLGMAVFADRRVVLDLGRGRLHLSQPLDLTVVNRRRRA